jgi:hypothetical protein
MINNIDDILERRHEHLILEDEKNEPVPLVYDKNVDYSLIKNVLLDHKSHSRTKKRK